MANLNTVDDEYRREYDILYREGFMEGYHHNILIDGPLDSISLDETNLYSLGYRDGQNYAEYCKLAGTDKDVKPENLIGQIDRTFSQAYSIFKNYEKNYSDYKKGFLDGKAYFIQQLSYEIPGVTTLPEINDENYHSLGYYDGYIFCLGATQQNSFIINKNNQELEHIIQGSFKKRKEIQKQEKSI